MAKEAVPLRRFSVEFPTRTTLKPVSGSKEWRFAPVARLSATGEPGSMVVPSLPRSAPSNRKLTVLNSVVSEKPIAHCSIGNQANEARWKELDPDRKRECSTS